MIFTWSLVSSQQTLGQRTTVVRGGCSVAFVTTSVSSCSVSSSESSDLLTLLLVYILANWARHKWWSLSGRRVYLSRMSYCWYHLPSRPSSSTVVSSSSGLALFILLWVSEELSVLTHWQVTLLLVIVRLGMILYAASASPICLRVWNRWARAFILVLKSPSSSCSMSFRRADSSGSGLKAYSRM